MTTGHNGGVRLAFGVGVRVWIAIMAMLIADMPSAHAAAGQITIVNFAFQPTTLTIQAGDSVTWTASKSNGVVSHTSTSDAPQPVWDSGPLSAGQSFTFTFTTPGDYKFHCAFHPGSMKGTIHVLGAHQTYLPVIED